MQLHWWCFSLEVQGLKVQRFKGAEVQRKRENRKKKQEARGKKQETRKNTNYNNMPMV
jgi:hypothetical protein